MNVIAMMVMVMRISGISQFHNDNEYDDDEDDIDIRISPTLF